MNTIKNKKNVKRAAVVMDEKLLKHWKSLSVKTKLDWLQDALYFGKLKKI